MSKSYFFSDVIIFLRKLKDDNIKSVSGKKLIKKEKLIIPQICLNLHLFLDSNQIIRVYTSVQNCPGLKYDQINPILLPREHKFSELVIKNAHIKAGHMGTNYTFHMLRTRFWITKNSSLIRRVIINCEICKKERGQRYHVPRSPPLPEYRFNIHNPYDYTAVDMTGHYTVKHHESQALTKVYLLIFVCMSTGSGHVEVVTSATSESFSEALEKFINRCGAPSYLLSDQGSNFKGYNVELKKLSDTVTTSNLCKDKGISWKWVPIGAPHMNGYVERHLGILKSIIKKTVGNKCLTLSQLETITTYAQAIFNERPLQVLNNSDESFLPITPNMLVFGRNLRHFSHNLVDYNLNDPDFKIGKDLNVMAKKLRSNLAQVRKVWIEQYYTFLTSRDKLRNKMSPQNKSCIVPEVGQFVLIKDDRDLKLGKIINLIHSDEDSEIRSCLVRTKNSEGIYPTCHLRYLEGYSGGDIPPSPTDVPNQEVTARKRLPRDAKEIATNKLKDLNLHLMGIFLSGPGKESIMGQWDTSSGVQPSIL